MRKSKLGALVALCMAVAVTFAFTGCNKSSSNSSSGQKIKVAFVYVGPTGDAGYTYAQDLGRKYLAQKMPNVQTTYVENVPETADCERVFTELAQKGNKVIFGTSYGYMDYMLNVAKKFPNVVFEHCSGYKTASNMGTYFNRDYQARYLTGMVAGKYSKSGTLGFVAPFGTPEVIRNIDAFTLGAQSVNPNIKVKVVWTNSWNDPPTEKTATNSLIDAGADVVAMHVDSPSFAETAQTRGVFSIGHDSNMSKFAPKSILVGDVSNWGPYFVKTVKAVQAGTWKSEQYWGGIADDGIIDITPFSSSVSKDFQQQVLAKKSEIVKGTFDPFSGPIYDQSGAVKVAQGQKATDDQLLSIDYFVKGIEGSIPKS